MPVITHRAGVPKPRRRPRHDRLYYANKCGTVLVCIAAYDGRTYSGRTAPRYMPIALRERLEAYGFVWSEDDKVWTHPNWRTPCPMPPQSP